MISILIPYAPAGPERETSWEWNRQRWRLLLPGAELVTAAPDRVGDPGLFCRALALNRAAEVARGEAFVIGDADTTCTPDAIGAALQAVALGVWTLPLRYVRLNERASSAWLAAGPFAPPPGEWEADIEQEYPVANSGLVVVPRAAFYAAGGFDERFTGWGGEDDAFACAATTLYGPPLRVGVAYHLWHPRPPEHSTGQPRYLEQCGLSDRYGAASGDREKMLALLDERHA